VSSDPTPLPPLTRRQRLLVSSQLWLLEVALLALLCWRYADTVQPGTLRGTLFVRGGALACAASLSLVPGLLCLLLAALARSRRVIGVVSALVWSVGLFLLWVDTRIWSIFRYHFNGLVWNVLTTPGADEAVHLSGRDVGLILGGFVLLLPLQYGAFRLLWRQVARRARQERATPLVARPALAWSIVLVPNMLLVAGLYAWADMSRDAQVLAFSRVYPLYPRLTFKRFAERHLGIKMKERPKVDLPASGILLDYPHSGIHLPPDGPRPNIVVIVIDSLRADMLTPEIMPRTSAFGREGRVFRDHYSAGNATRFGIFGLLYGMHGSYWKPVYSEHRSPVLVDALLERGYAVRVLTSASMDFPEFRSTAWVRVEGSVEDRLPFADGARDEGVERRFDEWLGENQAPFFAFLLLDAPHQSYDFPADCAPFQPYLDDVSYSTLDSDAPAEKRTALFNRYKNAVVYADRTTGRILDALAAHGHAEDTLVVVTGDHGEEFFENGFWGHTSNFSAPQVHVPFVLAGPGVPPGEEQRPTSHIDLPATLLELLGADPARRADWTLGANLLDPPQQRTRVISGWDTLGMVVGDSILEVPMAGYGGTEIAVYDASWRRRMDDGPILARVGPQLAGLALECRRFLR